MMVCSVVTGEQIRLFRKTPTEELDYGFSYEKQLEPNEQLDTSVWAIVAGTGGTLQIDNEAVDAVKSRVDVSSGAVGDADAELENTVTTTGGAMARTYVRRLAVRIVEKKGQ